jgi:uncharacterized membrane protein YedE/YeeE
VNQRWNLAAFAAGILFAVGLCIGGMTNPAKVIAFLDIAGDWDPALAFVMGGAIAVYAPSYRIITGRRHPVLEGEFSLPTKTDVDKRLILGAVAFGIGWGLVGLCPGPALVAMMTGRLELAIYGAAMVTGMLAFRMWDSRR